MKTADNTNSNSEQLIEREDIENTPFTIVKFSDKWTLVMGRYKIAGPFPTKDLALEASKDASWNTIMIVIQAMIDANLLEFKNSNK